MLSLDDKTTRGDDSKTALELDSNTVYMLSIADKLEHTEHMLQYLAHV